MNSFKKVFQKFNDNQKVSFKHSKSMPYVFSSEERKREPPRDNFPKPAYRGKTPLQKSDILYVEQAPGVLDINHSKLLLSQYTCYHGPTRTYINTHEDSLAKFPRSPEATEGLPRRGFRALSLNSGSDNPRMSLHNSSSRGQQAYPSTPCRKLRHGVSVDQISTERIRAKSSADRANIPPPRAPATPSRSARKSRVNSRKVSSHVAVPTPAPAYPRSYWPYCQFDEISHERNPTVLRAMINRYPLAPVCSARRPGDMRPMYFDMDEPGCLEKTLQWYIHMAFAERRPLDARAGGRYHRIVDECNMGPDPDAETDWYYQGGRR